MRPFYLGFVLTGNLVVPSTRPLLSRNKCNISIEDINLDIYIQVIVLLYADDTVLFARSEPDLLTLLDSFIEYCEKWKLDVEHKNISVW